MPRLPPGSDHGADPLIGKTDRERGALDKPSLLVELRAGASDEQKGSTGPVSSTDMSWFNRPANFYDPGRIETRCSEALPTFGPAPFCRWP